MAWRPPSLTKFRAGPLCFSSSLIKMNYNYNSTLYGSQSGQPAAAPHSTVQQSNHQHPQFPDQTRYRPYCQNRTEQNRTEELPAMRPQYTCQQPPVLPKAQQQRPPGMETQQIGSFELEGIRPDAHQSLYWVEAHRIVLGFDQATREFEEGSPRFLIEPSDCSIGIVRYFLTLFAWLMQVFCRAHTASRRRAARQSQPITHQQHPAPFLSQKAQDLQQYPPPPNCPQCGRIQNEVPQSGQDLTAASLEPRTRRERHPGLAAADAYIARHQFQNVFP